MLFRFCLYNATAGNYPKDTLLLKMVVSFSVPNQGNRKNVSYLVTPTAAPLLYTGG